MKLEVQHIRKSFSGKPILKDISFTVTSGKAMGFLGRNGAGKTTTIRTLMNVFPPDSGQFLLDGKPFRRHDHKIGYLPEERGMYPTVPLVDQLVYFGELKQMSAADARKAAHYWLQYLDLDSFAKKKLETLSKGNQQKIQILQAVLNDPDILILDEPFSGLDPVNAQVLKELIRSFIAKNRIVIFSSHQMGYVEEFCDDVTFIQNGSIILSADLKDTKRSLGKDKLRLSVRDLGTAALTQKIASIPDITVSADRHSAIITCENGKTPNQLLQVVLNLNLPVELFSFYEPSLEDIFILLEKDQPQEQEAAAAEGAQTK